MAPFLGFVVSLPEFHRITHLNAVREFHDHPFSVIPKDQASEGGGEGGRPGRFGRLEGQAGGADAERDGPRLQG